MLLKVLRNQNFSEVYCLAEECVEVDVKPPQDLLELLTKIDKLHKVN